MRFKKNAKWNGEEREYFILPSVIKYLNQNEKNSFNTPKIKINMDDWLEFMGYFLSEGCVQHHYKNRIPYKVHISQTKTENIKKIKDCIERIGFKYTYNKDKFSINSKQLAIYLNQFGKQRVRFIPRELLSLSRRQLTILLDALILGDGCVRDNKHGNSTYEYITSSYRLAGDLQELILKTGFSCNIHSRNMSKYDFFIKGRKIKPNGLIYEMTINGYKTKNNTNEPNINSNGKNHITKRKYNGMIYCVEVPNHIIYIRRNGYPVWCGNSVSVAKASIVATLPARTSVLAAANPKLSRFDPYIAIAKQINIPDTLLSRFDLKFALLDKPNTELDSNTVDHIIKSRNGEEDVLPKLSPDFLRKYVAYAKENCKPEFPTEVNKTLKDFYVRMRKRAEGGKSIPITLRQFEAMLRLAEASAKVQLSPNVRQSDADRAIKLMTFSLKQLGLDPETQEIDVDRVEGGVPSSERGKIRKLVKIIQAKFYDQKEIEISDLKEEAEKHGIFEIDDAIQQLLKNGEYYQPTPRKLAKP